MKIIINDVQFNCIDMQLPVENYSTVPTDDCKVGLYYTATKSSDNNIFRIYNKQKLNMYRITRLFDEEFLKLLSPETVEQCRTECIQTGKTKIPGEVTTPEMDFSIIYNPTALSNVPFLPSIETQDDKYVVYRIDNKYKVPVLSDMVNKKDLLKYNIFGHDHKCRGSELYDNIIKDILRFNQNTLRYISNRSPSIENLGWMCIYDITIGENNVNKFDSHIVCNVNTNNDWKFIAMHELWPMISSIGVAAMTELPDTDITGNNKSVIRDEIIHPPMDSCINIDKGIIYTQFLGKYGMPRK